MLAFQDNQFVLLARNFWVMHYVGWIMYLYYQFTIGVPQSLDKYLTAISIGFSLNSYFLAKVRESFLVAKCS